MGMVFYKPRRRLSGQEVVSKASAETACTVFAAKFQEHNEYAIPSKAPGLENPEPSNICPPLRLDQRVADLVVTNYKAPFGDVQ